MDSTVTPESDPNQPLPNRMPRKPIPLLFIIIILLFLLAISFLFYQNYQQKQLLNQVRLPQITTTQPTPTPINGIITDVSSRFGWKLYTNSEYSFTFSFPTRLSTCCGISGPAVSKPPALITLGDVSSGKEGTDAPFDGIAVYAVPKSPVESFSSFIEREKVALNVQSEQFTGEKKTNTGSSSTVNIADTDGILLRKYTWDGNDRYYVPFPDGSSVLVISTIQASVEFNSIINQILSTFRFIDSINDITLNWQTHNNSTYGYSFRYPDGWFLNLPPPGPTLPYAIFASSYNLSNYDMNRIERYMDHGFVNWQAFIGDKPAFKVDIYIDTQANVAKTSAKQDLNKLTKIPSIASIGNLPTTTFEAPPGPDANAQSYLLVAESDRLYVSLGVSIYNATVQSFFMHPDWKKFKQILSTFEAIQ